MEEAFVSRDGVLDDADGTDDEDVVVEGLGASNRLTAAGRCGAEELEMPSLELATLSVESSGKGDSRAALALYVSHRCSTEERLSGFLLSKLADRHSKQYAQ